MLRVINAPHFENGNLRSLFFNNWMFLFFFHCTTGATVSCQNSFIFSFKTELIFTTLLCWPSSYLYQYF